MHRSKPRDYGKVDKLLLKSCNIKLGEILINNVGMGPLALGQTFGKLSLQR